MEIKIFVQTRVVPYFHYYGSVHLYSINVRKYLDCNLNFEQQKYTIHDTEPLHTFPAYANEAKKKQKKY